MSPLCIREERKDEEELSFVPGCGVVPGGSIAAESFMAVHHAMIDKWKKETAEQDKILQAKSIVGGKEIDLSVTSFVDDVAKKVAATRHGRQEIEEASYRAHEILKKCCA